MISSTFRNDSVLVFLLLPLNTLLVLGFALLILKMYKAANLGLNKMFKVS